MTLSLDQFLSERLAADPTPLHVALLGYAVLDPEHAAIVAIAPLPQEVRELATVCLEQPETVRAAGLRGAAAIWGPRTLTPAQRRVATLVDQLRLSELATVGPFSTLMSFARPLTTPWATPILEADFPALAAWAAQAIATTKRSLDAAAAHELQALLAERWGDARGAERARAAAARALPSRIRSSSSRPEWERNLQEIAPTAREGTAA